MKTSLKIAVVVSLAAAGLLFVRPGQTGPIPGPTAYPLLAGAGLAPIGSQPVDDSVAQQLNSLFTSAVGAAKSIAPGPDAGAQRRAVDDELRAELESSTTNNPASAWTPSVHLWLGRRALVRCGYSLAMN
ncbi:MAG TPA: hypothetical protein VG146_03515, partial [Verrucomicrobiae bacterium]|nr:hypothetical protein [Verrucomicrobiae bacterium]